MTTYSFAMSKALEVDRAGLPPLPIFRGGRRRGGLTREAARTFGLGDLEYTPGLQLPGLARAPIEQTSRPIPIPCPHCPFHLHNKHRSVCTFRHVRASKNITSVFSQSGRTKETTFMSRLCENKLIMFCGHGSVRFERSLT